MSVIVANFGQGNWAWPDCRDRGVIVVMDDARVHPFQVAGDRDGYIAASMRLLRSRLGEAVTTAVASRWFNTTPLVLESVDDLWLHSDTKSLWWCRSTDVPSTSETLIDPQPRNGEKGVRVVYYRKPCSGWSSRNSRGQRLAWSTIHPRAKSFLAFQATVATLSNDNAANAAALVGGHDLSPWHERPEWKTGLAQASSSPGSFYDALRLTIFDAVDSMFGTGAASGSVVATVRKDKQVRFASSVEAEGYIRQLFEAAEGICALTGLLMQTKDGDDPERMLSIDRKDSDGHYERGNIQLVCRFANRWKRDSSDAEFGRLFRLIRSVAT